MSLHVMQSQVLKRLSLCDMYAANFDNKSSNVRSFNIMSLDHLLSKWEPFCAEKIEIIITNAHFCSITIYLLCLFFTVLESFLNGGCDTWLTSLAQTMQNFQWEKMWKKWYFVLEIVFTYFEKNYYKFWGWRPRIFKLFETTQKIYSNSRKSEHLWNPITFVIRDLKDWNS